MNIFRKVSLDRLSSPEQLDELMHVTGLRSWIALLALLLLLISASIWGFSGSIPTTVNGEGAIVRQGGIMNVVSRGAGILMELNVQVGDRVTANQVIGRVAQPAMMEKIKVARDSLARARQEREAFLKIHSDQAKLRVEAVERQGANDQRQIHDLEEQAKLANDQIRTADELFKRGLVTRQQTITARQNLKTIESQISTQQADLTTLAAQRSEFAAKPRESDSEVSVRITELEHNLTELEKDFDINTSIISPFTGQVIELKAYPGGTVAADTPVLSIQPEANDLEVLAYVPSLRAKEIRKGMEAQVSPSIVKREEFGFMRAEVVHVADFPATKAALMRNFENETMVTALTSAGPVTEIEIRMQSDPNTPSHFVWSSAVGPPIQLSSGTLCSLQVVTQRQKPVALLMPFLKGKLGVD